MKIEIRSAVLALLFCLSWPVASRGQNSEMIDLKNQTNSLLTEIATLKAEREIEKNTIAQLKEELKDHDERINILSDLLETSQGMLGEEMAKSRVQILRTMEALSHLEAKSGSKPSFNVSRIKVDIAKLESEFHLAKQGDNSAGSKTKRRRH